MIEIEDEVEFRGGVLLGRTRDDPIEVVDYDPRWPGRFKRIMPVGFPRPRDVVAIRGAAKFAALSAEIWSLIETEVRKARAAAE